MSLFLYNLNELDCIVSFPLNIRQWSQSNHTTNSTVSQTSLSPKAEEVSIREISWRLPALPCGNFYLEIPHCENSHRVTFHYNIRKISYNCSQEHQYKTTSWIWSLKTCEGRSTSGLLGPSCWVPFTPCWPSTEEGGPWFGLRLAGEPEFDPMLTGGERGWDKTLCQGQRSCWDAQRRRCTEKVHRTFDYTGRIFKCPSMWSEINQNRRMVPNLLRWHLMAVLVHTNYK